MLTPPLPIRILIADDHELFRDGLRILVKQMDGIQLIGEAANGKELLRLAAIHHPDVILTDIQMPEMDGLTATRQILQDHSSIFVVAMSMFGDDHLIVSMLQAGARGYLLKNAHKSQIEEAIRKVYTGETYYCSHSAARITAMIAKKKYNPYQKYLQPQFSEREKNIIRLVCEGFLSKQISDMLGISVRTVEGYRERIQGKMNVKNTAGVVVYAIRYGIYPAV